MSKAIEDAGRQGGFVLALVLAHVSHYGWIGNVENSEHICAFAPRYAASLCSASLRETGFLSLRETGSLRETIQTLN